jgi:hypothetical protein
MTNFELRLFQAYTMKLVVVIMMMMMKMMLMSLEITRRLGLRSSQMLRSVGWWF